MLQEGGYDAQKTQRIVQLEAMTQEMNSHIQHLQEQLTEKEALLVRESSAAHSGSDDQKALLEKVAALEDGRSVTYVCYLILTDLLEKTRVIRQLEKDLKASDEQIAIMEKALGQGQYDQENFRVLQLANNPASLAFADRDQALRMLQDENRELRERVKGYLTSVKEDAMQVDLVMPAGSFNALELENEQLKKQSQDLEKKMMRLKEVYKMRKQ
jgi:hypothetical protein